MTIDPSFEGLPADVLETHKRGLEQLAERENMRTEIPAHYATSLSELRSQQQQQVVQPVNKSVLPVQPVQPVQPAQPVNVELRGDIEDVTTVTALCVRASELLNEIASRVGGTDAMLLASLAGRFGAVEIHPVGELSIIYAKQKRAEGATWQSIADELNELLIEKPVYKPLRSARWSSRALKALVHARSNR